MGEEQLIREFIAEAEEHLLNLEPNLLRLEKEPSNLELINEIFLSTHSIKGTAAYVGLAHISNFTHSLESLLDPLRKETLKPSSELIDVLLKGIDTLKILLQHVAEGKAPPDITAISECLSEWQEYLNLERKINSNTKEFQAASSNVTEPAAAQVHDISFAPHELEIDREDCEIFVDISRQQLEFMRLTLDRLRESNLEEGDDGLVESLTELVKAFHKIRSSAAILEVDTLDNVLSRHADVFSLLQEPDSVVTPEALDTVSERLSDLERLIGQLASYAADVNPAQPPVVADVSSPITRSVDFSRGRYTLRVEAERVDALLNLVGELVINRAGLVRIGKEIKTIYEDLRIGELELQHHSLLQRKKNIRTFKKLKEHFDEIRLDLGRLTDQMQEATMRIRMVPIRQVVSQFPRMVRDLSRQAGKDVVIEIAGSETELDKTVIDLIGEPLIHLIRNAIDHGIESPDERNVQGKSTQGKITLAAYYEGNQVIITIKDDGRGLDLERIKQKAIQHKIISIQEAETLKERELAYLIFHSGFSTVESVSSLSGRGVGLSVVKRHLEKINGAIELESKFGLGSTFIIKLPLTLAIIPALMVQVRSELFAIPLTSVEEAIRFTTREIKTIESHKVIHLRERMIPLLELGEIFGSSVFQSNESAVSQIFLEEHAIETTDKDTYYGVIISDGFREVGIIVDTLFGESDIVIKPLNDELVNVEGISGASIRGDGQVSLVIDAVSLINVAVRRVKDIHRMRAEITSRASTQYGECV